METCDICGKEIPEGTGDKFLDRDDDMLILCDECIAEDDYYS